MKVITIRGERKCYKEKLKTCDPSGENIDQFENDDDEVFITTNCGRASTMIFEM